MFKKIVMICALASHVMWAEAPAAIPLRSSSPAATITPEQQELFKKFNNGFQFDAIADKREKASVAFAALGVPATADLDAVKKAYRKLSLAYHPDKNPEGVEVFKQLSNVYSYFGVEDQKAITQLRKDAAAYKRMRVTNIKPTAQDLTMLGGGTARIASDMKKRADRIDVMSGTFYAAADKDLLAQHAIVATWAETVSSKFGGWYKDTIVIENIEHKAEYLEMLNDALATLKKAKASLELLADKKKSNADFQRIRREILDQAAALMNALDRLKAALRTV